MSGVRIREMTLGDCERVAEIRVQGWRSAYRGMIPQSYLDGLGVAEDTERRRTRFLESQESGGTVLNLIAVQDGEVIGWACHGPYREGEVRTGDVELYAIYVDPDRFGAGAGRALIEESIRRCGAAGHERMYLWVLEENARARRFYERSGFRADGVKEPFEVDGVPVPEVRYVRELTD